MSWTSDELSAELTQASQHFAPAQATASHEAYFGPQQQTQVVVFESSPSLIALHNYTVYMLKTGDIVFNDPQYSEAGFLPHATVQSHARVNIGDTVTISKIALVDMFPNEDPYRRKILKLIQL